MDATHPPEDFRPRAEQEGMGAGEQDPFLVLVGLACPALAADEGFQSLFDGKTLSGWHTSAQTGHSATSQHKTAGRWVVEDGAIVGSQDVPGNGGIVLTDESFGDFEVALEMRNEFGPDSGLVALLGLLDLPGRSLSRCTAGATSPSSTSATAGSGSSASRRRSSASPLRLS